MHGQINILIKRYLKERGCLLFSECHIKLETLGQDYEEKSCSHTHIRACKDPQDIG